MKTGNQMGVEISSTKVKLLVLTGAVFVMSAILIWVASVRAGKPDTVIIQDSPLQISEYMSSNRSAFPDDKGIFNDWIELHNTGPQSMDLTGHALTDMNNTWLLPKTTLAPDSYLVIFCSGQSTDANHANFRLKAAGGETISIKNAAGEIVESITTIALETNHSAIRDGNTFRVSACFTPGYANSDEGHNAFQASRRIQQTDLLINEVMPANTGTYPDSQGEYSDYIELANRSKRSISLARYGLSNDINQPLKWQFPDVSLKPGETILVFASGKNTSDSTRELHASFKINKDQDRILLSSPAGIMIDSVEITGIDANMALCRCDDGSWLSSETPSPGFPNTDAGIESFWKERDKRHPHSLRINEIMPRNTPKDSKNTQDDVRNGTIAGEAYDWIELYNSSLVPISLKGYSIANDPDMSSCYPLPDITIPAGGYRLIFCTGEPVSTNPAYIQANFKLNGNSGVIFLISPESRIADVLAYNNLPMGTSQGRSNKSAGYYYFSQPTPGAANPENGKRRLSPAPMIVTKSGLYNSVENIQVELSGIGSIYYTLDGSDPDSSCALYKGPVALSKTTALRAIAIVPGALPSDVTTASFVLNENHSVDVVSLVTDPDNLWDTRKGIYVKGSGASSVFPYTGANFWMDWERDAHIELFTQTGSGFSAPCGIKIFGQYSRGYEKKSLSVIFRDCYGLSSLYYPVFESRDFLRYESLILRSTGQDRMRTLMRDVLVTSLADDTGILDTQAYRPIVLYVNGEYFGLYYLREKINEHFISTHRNVSPGSVDLLKGDGIVNYGSNADYRALIQYVESHDLRQDEHYRYVLDRIDPVSYCDFKIAQIYCANGDTGNIRFYRSSDTDGKWRWILYDTDMAFRGDPDRFWHNINPEGTGHNNAFSNALICNLLKNDDFRALFIKRLEFNMKNTWSTKRVLARVDELCEAIGKEIPRNHKKYGITTNWENEMISLRKQIKGRQAAIKQELSSKPEVAAIFRLTPSQINQCFE